MLFKEKLWPPQNWKKSDALARQHLEPYTDLLCTTHHCCHQMQNQGWISFGAQFGQQRLLVLGSKFAVL